MQSTQNFHLNVMQINVAEYEYFYVFIELDFVLNLDFWFFLCVFKIVHTTLRKNYVLCGERHWVSKKKVLGTFVNALSFILKEKRNLSLALQEKPLKVKPRTRKLFLYCWWKRTWYVLKDIFLNNTENHRNKWIMKDITLNANNLCYQYWTLSYFTL